MSPLGRLICEYAEFTRGEPAGLYLRSLSGLGFGPEEWAYARAILGLTGR